MTVYEMMTDRIIAQLEKGTVPWQKPWNGTTGLPKNLQSGKVYRGINLFMLGCSGFASPYWLTFKQCKAKGGSIKAGSKATPVIFWKFLEKENSETGETDSIPMLRYYQVFNVDQCGGIEAPDEEEAETIDFQPIEEAENIVKGFKASPKLTHEEARAYYRPCSDMINMPKAETFRTEEEYYSTLFHEMTHSTGHEARLNRKTITDLCPFGSTNYSKEELIAEMGAAFLCGHAGIENKTIDNSAAYIQHWVRKFKDKPKMVVTAAAQAQKAADFILGV